MEQLDTSRDQQSARPREEADGPPRAGWRPVVSLIGFGLLLVVTLLIDALSDASTMSGAALTFAGIMLLAGVADLLDPAARRLAAGVRIGGMVMALLGLAVQFIG